MPNGDAAADAGMDTVPGTADLRDSYDDPEADFSLWTWELPEGSSGGWKSTWLATSTAI